MTNAPVPRDPWSLLLFKAKHALEARQHDLAQARARQRQMQASEARLAQLLGEYRLRQAAVLSGGQLMIDSLNDRQFIAQLQRLMDQARAATAAAARQVEAQVAAVAQAQREVDKAEKLLEQARSVERARQERTVQKVQDEWAMMRFRHQDA